MLDFEIRRKTRRHRNVCSSIAALLRQTRLEDLLYFGDERRLSRSFCWQKKKQLNRRSKLIINAEDIFIREKEIHHLAVILD